MRTAVLLTAPLLFLTAVVLTVFAVLGRVDKFMAVFDQGSE